MAGASPRLRPCSQGRLDRLKPWREPQLAATPRPDRLAATRDRASKAFPNVA